MLTTGLWQRFVKSMSNLRMVRRPLARSKRGRHPVGAAEVLECRQLLSMTVTISGSSVTFAGDGANDSLTLTVGTTGLLTHNLALGGNLVSAVDLDSATGGEQSLVASGLVSLTILGGDGDDYLDASSLGCGLSLYGNDGHDTLLAGSGNDYIEGGAGDDLLMGSDGNDDLRGDSNWAGYGIGDDTLHGGSGDDQLTGDDGEYGGFGDDVLEGGAGDDILNASFGGNLIQGGMGTDWFIVGIAAATAVYTTGNLRLDGVDFGLIDVEGGRVNGNDDANSIDFSLFAGNLQMFGNGGNDTLLMGSGNDYAEGGTGDDLLEGNGGNNYLRGDSNGAGYSTGNDTVRGGPGYDELFGDDATFGGSGNDVLAGGESDFMNASDGDNRFDVRSAFFNRVSAGSGYDKIAFTAANIKLDLLNANIEGIEEIDVTGTGNNLLTIDAAKLISLSHTTDTLIVRGNVGDIVNKGTGWSFSGTEVITGSLFKVFSQGVATLKLQQATDLWLQQNPDLTYQFDEENPAGFGGSFSIVGVQGYQGLGAVGNQFDASFLRSTSSATLTLTNLPAHDAIDIGFLLAIIDSWDGTERELNFTGDYFNILVDGSTVFRESFNFFNPAEQSYVPPVDGLLSFGTHLGFSDRWQDSAYDLGVEPKLQSISHQSPSLTVEWLANGPGWWEGDDEAWAIDNLRIALRKNDEVPNNLMADQHVANLQTRDIDPRIGFSYSLVSGEGDSDNSYFAISGSDLRTARALDPAKTSYSIRVCATDDNGVPFEKQLIIPVSVSNQSPTDISLSSTKIAGNASPDTVVGSLSTTDPDTGNTFTYSLVTGSGDADNPRFIIEGDLLKTAVPLDFGSQSTYSIRVRTTDQGGLYYEKSFTIDASSVDLSITKTDGKTSAVPGTNTTYTLTVWNTGPIDITGATVTDTFPAGTTFVSSTLDPAQFTVSGNTFTYVLGALANGASESFDISVAIDATATGILTNTAEVAPPAGIFDFDPSNNVADDINVLTPEADLVLSTSNGVAVVVPGTNTTYTLTITNVGRSTVTGALVTDTLPAGTTFVSTTASASTYTLLGNTFRYTTGTLATGGTESFSITLAIAATATGSLTNSASVATPAGVTDIDSTNDSDAETDPLTPEYDLGITKTDGRDAVSAGGTTTYTIVVSNAGPSTATNVAVIDKLPAGTTSGSWSGNGISGTGSIDTTINSLLPGDSVTFTYTVTISASLTGTLFNPALLVNTATVMAINDTNPSNNSATDTNSVQNGRTIGYYSNKNGQAELTGSTSGKTLRSAVYNYLFAPTTGVLANGSTLSVLVNAKGSALPLSYFSSYANVQSFLLNATAANMANMLSAQMLATQFNIVLGRVDPNQTIQVSAVKLISGGSVMSPTLQQSLTTQPDGVTGWTQVTSTTGGKATLKTILDAAILQLKTNLNTTSAGGKRTFQEALKNLLDAINNNQNIFC